MRAKVGTWTRVMTAFFFLTSFQCLIPYEIPPEPPLVGVPDTTLNDTGIIDGGPFNNPVIAGFYPDPSVCRVGEDYYLVNSSFEYFPGIPVFHSRDLVHWRQIGHCMTRTSQLDLKNTPSNAGISAPTIRYYNGTFFIIVTETGKKGTIIVTAADPAGPWSDPVSVVTTGFDPSLFFDDNGKVYFQSQEGSDSASHIVQCVIDPYSGKIIGAKKTIWTGDGDVWLEGPHLYKINGIYYLTAASGGTGMNHHQVIAASNRVFGPYINCPSNPILLHTGTDEPIQYTGHADIFQDHLGHWWAVFLAVRHMNVGYAPLGRETFLSPVRWNKGWPVIGEGGNVFFSMNAPVLEQKIFEQPSGRDEFENPELPFHYVFIRNPVPGSFSLTERNGWLRLHGTGTTLSDQDAPAFLGRRQQHLNATIIVKMDFSPHLEGDEAGITVRLNEQAHYDLAVARRSGSLQCIMRSCTWGNTVIVDSISAVSGISFLKIECSHETYVFSHSEDTGSFVKIAALKTKPLTMESVMSFTGAVIGMYATGNGRRCSTPADFDWLAYDPREEGF